MFKNMKNDCAVKKSAFSDIFSGKILVFSMFYLYLCSVGNTFYAKNLRHRKHNYL